MLRTLTICHAAALAGVVSLGALAVGSGQLPAGADPSAGTVRAAATTKSYTFQTASDSADPTFNQLLGINDLGEIAGYYGSGADATHPNKGFTVVAPYAQPNFTNENFPSSVQTQVIGIDNAGDTVGFYVDKSGANHGFTDIAGTFTTVDNPASTASPTFNQLLGINNKGVAVGFYMDSKGDSHGYTYDIASKTFTPAGPAGPASTVATGINDNGDVVGYATSPSGTSGGYLISGGMPTTLLFAGATSTQPLGVNNTDQVVGMYTDSSMGSHGFTYSGGRYASVDDPSGVGTTVINGLNNKGQLVGYYVDSGGNLDGMVVNVSSNNGLVVNRVSGATRIATAIAVSHLDYPTTGSAGAVVLCREDGFADALAGTALAASNHAPILLTGTAALDPSTQAEISRVLPAGGTVYLLGGPVALSDAVSTQLTTLGFKVVRYAGADRFATSTVIAGALGDPKTILLADGTNFPDALAAGAAAAKLGGTVLTTEGPTLTSDVSAYLTAHPNDTVYAIGGPAAAADPAATAIAGTDRYATAVMVAEKFFTGPTGIGLADGTNYPDALTGGAASAVAGVPILLTDPDALSAATLGYLSTSVPTLTTVTVYGGPVSVTPAVFAEVEQP